MNESNVRIAVLSLYFVNDYLEYHTLHLFFSIFFSHFFLGQLRNYIRMLRVIQFVADLSIIIGWSSCDWPNQYGRNNYNTYM